MLYEKDEQAAVTCNLCAHRCYVPAGREGICKVRENHAGVLYTLVYDRVIAANIDPVEKKPLFHFLPGTEAYSIATVGCNFHCRYCQNWEISQLPRIREGAVLGEKLTPTEIVSSGARSRLQIHRLHLHGTDHLLRTRLRYGKTGDRSRSKKYFCHERLHDGGSFEDDSALSARG